MSWRRSRGRLRWEVEQEALAAVRAEVGATVLSEQLACRIGSEATVLAGAGAFRGGVVAATWSSSSCVRWTAAST
jgi:hypothetical protein